jgi:hypothetical protein
MPIGDDADAAGMETLAGTEDLRDTYIEHNRTRDYLANHQASGTHDAAAINAGTLDLARIPTITNAKIDTVASSKVTGQWTGDIETPWSLKLTGAAGILAPAIYDQSVAGMGGWRSLNVAANGVFGGLTSSARFKQDIETADIPRATLRQLRVVCFRYIADVEHGDDLPQIGLIAEEVHELGLTWLVDYDADGAPYALNDRAFPFIALLLAQDAEDRIDTLTTTVYDLIARVQQLEGGAA